MTVPPFNGLGFRIETGVTTRTGYCDIAFSSWNPKLLVTIWTPDIFVLWQIFDTFEEILDFIQEASVLQVFLSSLVNLTRERSEIQQHQNQN